MMQFMSEVTIKFSNLSGRAKGCEIRRSDLLLATFIRWQCNNDGALNHTEQTKVR